MADKKAELKSLLKEAMCFSLACICDFATASRMVQGALALPLGGRTSFDREVKTEKCAEFTPLS